MIAMYCVSPILSLFRFNLVIIWKYFFSRLFVSTPETINCFWYEQLIFKSSRAAHTHTHLHIYCLAIVIGRTNEKFREKYSWKKFRCVPTSYRHWTIITRLLHSHTYTHRKTRKFNKLNKTFLSLTVTPTRMFCSSSRRHRHRYSTRYVKAGEKCILVFDFSVEFSGFSLSHSLAEIDLKIIRSN